MEGLGGGTRCASALALGEGVPRDELDGVVAVAVVVTVPLRARFLGGETDEERGEEGRSRSSFF